MPTPTTGREIKAQVKEALHGITPRYSAAARWKHYPQRTDAKPGLRWFTLRFEIEGHTEGLFGQASNTVGAVLTVITDYGGVHEDNLDTLAGDDFLQLHDVINALRSTNNGIRTVRAIDWDYTDGERSDEAQVTHQFAIRFLKPRATTS